MRTALVTGAAGFIGSHLVTRLKAEGYWVCGVDIRPQPEFGWRPPLRQPDEYLRLDLRVEAGRAFQRTCFDEVYQLAADMGGIGYITRRHAAIARNNSMINSNVFEAARIADVGALFYSSSACVYPAELQNDAAVVPLKETDAWPAQPERGYGLEKLFAEELLMYYAEEYAMNVRIARFHNIFGPYGTYRGGREKVPAALCRKVAEAARDGKGHIDIWGDGEQTRSFLYIDDCVEGIRRLMRSSYARPLNLGSSELVTVNQLADLVMETAGVTPLLDKVHVAGPQGVRGRNCDPTLMVQVLGWAPQTTLREGLRRTYPWVRDQVSPSGGVGSEAFEVYEKYGRCL